MCDFHLFYLESYFYCFGVSGFHNGQLLARLTATIAGFCQSRLLFDHEEVPDALAGSGVGVCFFTSEPSTLR